MQTPQAPSGPQPADSVSQPATVQSTPVQSTPVQSAPVQSATTAAGSAAQEQDGRMRRYLWTMGFRVLCFPLAILCEGWLRWAFVAGAVVLPYIAVVLANAVGSRAAGSLSRPVDSPRAITDTTPAPALHGTIVDHP